MRTNLNDTTQRKLLEIMNFYGYSNVNHTLNVVIGYLHKSIFNENPIKEVKNDSGANPNHH